MNTHRRLAGVALAVLGLLGPASTAPAVATHQRVSGTVMLYGGTHTICDINLGCAPFMVSRCQPNEVTENNPFGNVRSVAPYTSTERRADFIIQGATPDVLTAYSMYVQFLNAACARSAPVVTVNAPLGQAKEIVVPRGAVWAVVYTCCANLHSVNLEWSMRFKH